MVWHPETRALDSEITNVLTVSRGIGNPVFSHDGKTLASALLNGGILLSEVATGRSGMHLDTFDVPVAFTADGRCLLTQDRNLRNTLRSWDLGTRVPTGSTRYSGDAWSNYCDSFSDEMKWVAVHQRKGQVVVASTLTGELLFTFQLPSVPWAIAFSPDGKLGTAGYDGSAEVWDSATQRLVFAVDRFKDTVQGLAFSPDGRLFAAGSWDTTIKVIDLRAKKQLAFLIGHKAGVLALAFSSDGRTLASGGDDESVRLWNIATGNEVLKYELASPVKFLGFSPDGRTLAAGTADRKVYLWHAPTVEEIDASDHARTATGIAP
jgi:WD40 repeat protein